MFYFQETYVSTTGNNPGWHLALARQLGAHEGTSEPIGFEYGDMSFFGVTSCSLVGSDFMDFLRCNEKEAPWELHRRLLEILRILSKAYPKGEIYMLTLYPWEVQAYIWRNGQRASESYEILYEYADKIRGWKEDCLDD